MVVIGAINGRTLLYRTASVLELDSSRQLLLWKSTFGSGQLSTRTIQQVVRAPHRPSVWMIQSADGNSVPFWLISTGPDVHSFFDLLASSHPQVSTETLYSGRGWWRGLPQNR
jgi:hypothetical protein